jgi:hypothetical protein
VGVRVTTRLPARDAVAPLLGILVLGAMIGTAACTYDFDKFAAREDAALATPSGGNGGTVTNGGASGTGTEQGGSGGGVAAQGGSSGGTRASGAGGTAGTGSGGAGGGAGACSGPNHGGVCWYLGALGSSCRQVCASHGDVAPDLATYVGTSSQGGSADKCALLLGLLGLSPNPTSGSRSDGLGLGCHVYQSQPPSLWWLTSPNFSVTASYTTVRVVCGCTQ